MGLPGQETEDDCDLGETYGFWWKDGERWDLGLGIG